MVRAEPDPKCDTSPNVGLWPMIPQTRRDADGASLVAAERDVHLASATAAPEPDDDRR